MLDPKNITACLVTRGNVDMQPIIDTLPYGEVLIYDNSQEHVDLKVFGRYELIKRASNDVIYWQDDDVIFTEHEALMEIWFEDEGPMFIANNAHGPNVGGYDDLALQAAGALCPRSLITETWAKWWMSYPQNYPINLLAKARALQDDGVKMPVRGSVRHTLGVLYEADFIFGVLCENWKQINLPYTRLYADDETHPHLCRQPWQEDLKLEMTNYARAVRDAA